MRMREGRSSSSGGGTSAEASGSRMSTLDYLVTKVKRHVRANSADATSGHQTKLVISLNLINNLYQ